VGTGGRAGSRCTKSANKITGIHRAQLIEQRRAARRREAESGKQSASIRASPRQGIQGSGGCTRCRPTPSSCGRRAGRQAGDNLAKIPQEVTKSKDQFTGGCLASPSVEAGKPTKSAISRIEGNQHRGGRRTCCRFSCATKRPTDPRVLIRQGKTGRSMKATAWRRRGPHGRRDQPHDVLRSRANQGVQEFRVNAIRNFTVCKGGDLRPQIE